MIEKSLATQEADVAAQIQRIGTTRQVPAGSPLFTVYDPCENYVLVVEGQVRVELLSITGQQLTLYRIHQGQPCVLTTACLMSGNNYSAQAIAESDVVIAMLPKKVFTAMLADSVGFRQFVFDGFSERLAGMMQRTNELATYSIDQRLAAALVARIQRQQDKLLAVTHEELAVEIGTAREVVSRRLAVFEKKGVVKRHRKNLEVQDENRLTEMLAK